MTASNAASNLQPYLAESDPVERWMPAYQAAKDRYDVVKWPSYVLGLVLPGALFFAVAYAVFVTLLKLPIAVGFAIWIYSGFDAWLLRLLVGMLPWLPWPSWAREFTTLHEALAPFDRVLRRKRGEGDE